tara:strand:+ start:4548 stop:4928 length:381 start_codon:yes stop_codon:yes gene_type:complete
MRLAKTRKTKHVAVAIEILKIRGKRPFTTRIKDILNNEMFKGSKFSFTMSEVGNLLGKRKDYFVDMGSDVVSSAGVSGTNKIKIWDTTPFAISIIGEKMLPRFLIKINDNTARDERITIIRRRRFI